MDFSKPNIGSLEIEYVTKALKEGHLSDGVVVHQFEEAFKEKFGYRRAVAMNSGTSALHVALMVADVGPGDEVIVTPYTFVASVNVVLAVGAIPVFADIDPFTYNMDPESVRSLLTPRTKAVIPVDVFGVPCDMAELRKVIPSTVWIIEDAIEAIGTTYKGKPIGYQADMVAFGFFPNKQITTAEGGMLVVTNGTVEDSVRRFVQHGATSGDAQYKQWGLNLRMTDLQAAMGVAQLERFEEITKALCRKSALLDRWFFGYKGQRVEAKDNVTPFVYVIELPPQIEKGSFIKEMAKLDVPVKPYFNNLTKLPHLQPFFRYCKVATQVSNRTIALPLRYDLSEDEAEKIYWAFKQVTWS